MSTWDTLVIGAGAAGLMAAASSASGGQRTLLLEKNRKLGVKILMSGGTRCNITHDCDVPGIVDAFQRQGNHGKFLLTALYTCLLYTSPSPRDLSTSRMPSSA